MDRCHLVAVPVNISKELLNASGRHSLSVRWPGLLPWLLSEFACSHSLNQERVMEYAAEHPCIDELWFNVG